MRNLSATVLGLLLSVSSFGMSLTCVTSIPTTSVTAEVESNELVVNVIHHWGMKYMPITTTQLTPSEVPEIFEKIKTFEQLGDHYVFRYDLNNCKRTDEDLFSCSNGQEVDINGVRVKPWGVYTKRIHTEMDIAELDEIEVNFNMAVDGKLQHISKQYLKRECEQTEKNKEVIAKFLDKKSKR